MLTGCDECCVCFMYSFFYKFILYVICCQCFNYCSQQWLVIIIPRRTVSARTMSCLAENQRVGQGGINLCSRILFGHLKHLKHAAFKILVTQYQCCLCRRGYWEFSVGITHDEHGK